MNINVGRLECGEIAQIVKMDLAICILFYEKLEQTIECIQSFLPSGVNIYILNNGSSNSSRQALGKFCEKYKQVKIFDSDENLGVGVGRNFLISHTTEEWILSVDNDIVMKTPDWLKKFVGYVSLYRKIEVFIPELFNIHDDSYVTYGASNIAGDKVRFDGKIVDDLIDVFPGGASFINRRLFNRLGPFDDKMFVGFEDYEFCIRAIRIGNPIEARLIHDIKLIHDHRRAIRNEDKNAILMRYNAGIHEASSNRIAEKHGIIIDVDWETWVSVQSKKTLNWHSRIFSNSWYWFIPRSIRRILKKKLQF